MLDDLDRAIVRELQGNIPLDPHPFAVIASRVGASEEEVLRRVRSYWERGWLRRVAAVLYHQAAGFRGNAMVVWKVPPEQVERFGRLAATFPQVTHCYERAQLPDFPYNVYTMVHGGDDEACVEVAQAISAATGIAEYLILTSTKEYKKTSACYIQ
ncbi:MAG: AsnC family transcriptional regulator [Bacillota bacterium]